MRVGKKSRLFIILLALWLIATSSLVTAAAWKHPAARAKVGMGWGLIGLWIGVGGGLMFFLRERVQALAARVRLSWRWQFILFATVLALVEEAIATTMTNLVLVFGARPGEAFITASANYIDVVTMHSVVVFAPMFVGWQWMLVRWRFTPF